MISLSPVVPVLTIERAKDAVPLARALLAGGLKVLEVTLRTPAALEAMARIAGEVEGAVLAAGTVLSPTDLERAAKAGARLAFSPGMRYRPGQRRRLSRPYQRRLRRGILGRSEHWTRIEDLARRLAPPF
jgi:hypothetical protein